MPIPFLYLFGLLVWTSRASAGEVPRPVLVFQHLANSRSRATKAINDGANALEVDLRFSGFDEGAKPTVFLHTSPCFDGLVEGGPAANGKPCWSHTSDICDTSTPAVEHFEFLRDISTHGHDDYMEGFSGQIWLDLKLEVFKHQGTALEAAGKNLADLLVDKIFDVKNHASRLRMAMELYTPLDTPFIVAFSAQLGSRKRKDILERTVVLGEVFDKLGEYQAGLKDSSPGFWSASGCGDCGDSCGLDVRDAKRAVEERDRVGGKGVDKVVKWTIDPLDHVVVNLDVGIDGIITNHPNVVVDYIKTKPEKFRLADSNDSIK